MDSYYDWKRRRQKLSLMRSWSTTNKIKHSTICNFIEHFKDLRQEISAWWRGKEANKHRYELKTGIFIADLDLRQVYRPYVPDFAGVCGAVLHVSLLFRDSVHRKRRSAESLLRLKFGAGFWRVRDKGGRQVEGFGLLQIRCRIHTSCKFVVYR